MRWDLVWKFGLAAGAALGAYFLFWPKSAKAATPTGSATDAAKAGDAYGCKLGTADGKTGVETLNPIDPTTDPALAKAAKDSGDVVSFTAAASKAYDRCYAAAAPVAKPPPAGHDVKLDCTVQTTWPAAVSTAWNDYQAHKNDGATSAYAKSGKASLLYGQFLKIGCAGNAAVVQKTIQSWIDAGGIVTGGPDCKDMSTWPKEVADAYALYLKDPRAFVDINAFTGPALVKALAALGCPGTAAAVQHTYDLEFAAGNVPTSTSGALVGAIWNPVRRFFNTDHVGPSKPVLDAQQRAIVCMKDLVLVVESKSASGIPSAYASFFESAYYALKAGRATTAAFVRGFRAMPSSGDAAFDKFMVDIDRCLVTYLSETASPVAVMGCPLDAEVGAIALPRDNVLTYIGATLRKPPKQLRNTHVGQTMARRNGRVNYATAGWPAPSDDVIYKSYEEREG